MKRIPMLVVAAILALGGLSTDALARGGHGGHGGGGHGGFHAGAIHLGHGGRGFGAHAFRGHRGFAVHRFGRVGPRHGYGFRRYGYGFHRHFYHHGGYGLHCYRWHRVLTPFGWRLHRVNICYPRHHHFYY